MDEMSRVYFLSFLVYYMCILGTQLCSAVILFSVYPMDSLSNMLPGGGLSVPVNTHVLIRLVGDDLSFIKGIFFTTDIKSCSMVKRTDTFSPMHFTHENRSVVIKIILEDLLNSTLYWHVCLIIHDTKTGKHRAVHQGSDEWLRVAVFSNKDSLLLPLWLQILICVILLLCSGLFSGLNLGLMSLDQTELKIIEKVGSPSEKRHAKRIGPLRKRGNLLLCSLLLGNVLVNSTFTILFDNMTNGLMAVICSTIGIVIFGEIVPQAICSRHGLAVGAKTYWVTIFFIIITLPASYPISLILDFLLGEEMGQVFNKEKLQELIRLNTDRRILHEKEANIIAGALQLTSKCVEDVMTKIEDVYMLDINTVLDFEAISEIMHEGYTRIPIYDGDKTNIVNLLNTKELALIDPDDKTLVSTVCKFYDHRPLYVDHDVKLDAMLQAFLQAGCSHMAIVQKLQNTDDRDPYYENLGVITLEDVIEEILQSEIVDETDLRTDNRHRRSIRPKEDYDLLVPEAHTSTLPKQLAFAAFQFLTTTVEPFSDAHLARNVLKTLMKKDIVVTLCPTEPVSKKNYIFQKGVPSDKFVLILQGTVEVEIGDESMVFETGPFSFFGVECINSSRTSSMHSDTGTKEYIPDFSVRALTDVQYLCINRHMYIAALRTTRLLRQGGNIVLSDAFEAEYEKVRRNENHSSCDSVSESYFPQLSVLQDTVRIDESVRKRVAVPLERPIFFHRKCDPLEGLYSKLQNGFDSGDQSQTYQGETDVIAVEHVMQAELNTSFGGNDSFADPLIPKSNSDSKMTSSSSPACLSHNNHLDIFKDLVRNGLDIKDEVTETHDLENLEHSFHSKVVTESTAGHDILVNHLTGEDTSLR